MLCAYILAGRLSITHTQSARSGATADEGGGALLRRVACDGDVFLMETGEVINHPVDVIVRRAEIIGSNARLLMLSTTSVGGVR